VTQPSPYNIVLEQGATFHRTITWKRGDTEETATPVDLTSWIARLQIREKINSDTEVISLTTESGHITLGGELGTIDILITDEETAAMDFDGPAFYDLELESPDGEVKRFLHGRVGFSREVTREDAS
jgi:hypothetical protein